MKWTLIAAISLAAACDSSATATPTAPPTGAPSANSDSAAGLVWTVPDDWSRGGDRAMRVATYALPGGAECAVFHFPGTGGSVDANIARWAGQFEGSPQPETSKRQISGLAVTIVELAGTYLSPGGPMMKSTGKKPDYRLHGAIVEGPKGNVFFKITGPATSIEANQKAIETLLADLRSG